MNNLIIVRGGGDLATGTIYKLYKSGFRVLVLEIANPSAIRRNVAFSEAVYRGIQTVEDMTCVLAGNVEEAAELLEQGKLVMLVDPQGDSISRLKPMAVVDGILAKKNLGTRRNMAPITVALGPGFEAGKDVDAVVETMRGHSLGRVIYQGSAIPDTGIPGAIAGHTKDRVIHSPGAGVMRNVCQVTDTVKKGELIAEIEQQDGTVLPVEATIDGLLRGLIRDGYPVTKGFKIADIDPRLQEYNNCFTISDKARCIAGGVLEAILHLSFKRQSERRKGSVGCVIMASGLSKRFGRNKLIEEFQGKTLIQRALDLTEGDLFERRIVLTRSEEVRRICESQNIPVLFHDLPERSDAVALGIREMMDLDGCLFCPCDQPLLKRSSLECLVSEFTGEMSEIRRLSYGGKAGSPILFGKGLFEELSCLPHKKGGSYLAQKYPEQVCLTEAEHELELYDVDTAEAFERLKKAALHIEAGTVETSK